MAFFWTGGVKYRDAYNRESVRRVGLSDPSFGANYAAMLTFVSDLRAISEANVLGFSLTYFEDVVDVAAAGANLDEGVTFSMDLGSGKKGIFKVPAPEKAIFNPDGSVILTDTLVTALEAELIGGIVTISDGEVPLGILSGKLDK